MADVKATTTDGTALVSGPPIPTEAEFIRSFSLVQRILRDRGFGDADIPGMDDSEYPAGDRISYAKLDVVPGERAFIADSVGGASASADGGNNPLPVTIVRWVRSEMLRGDDVTALAREGHLIGAVHWIVVVKNGITTACNETIGNLHQDNIHIDVWKFNETLFCIFDHVYSPSYRLLSEREREVIIAQYNIVDRTTHIPAMKRIDPVARHFGASVGDMFEINRKSQTLIGETEISYRIVIED